MQGKRKVFFIILTKLYQKIMGKYILFSDNIRKIGLFSLYKSEFPRGEKSVTIKRKKAGKDILQWKWSKK